MEQAPLFDFPGKESSLLKGGDPADKKQMIKTMMSVVHTKVKTDIKEDKSDSLEEELLKARKEVEAAYKSIATINKDITDSITYSKRIQDGSTNL